MPLEPKPNGETEEVRAWRRKRFRILVCVNGTEESYQALRFAAEIGRSKECDIILAYVRPTDQGLRTGGLQIRVARENMLDWGLELPGVKYLRKGLELLVEAGHMEHEWDSIHTHTDVWGDPLGDNKIEYQHEDGKSIVLKLKTAPDIVSGILDQYELGPYNLMALGQPSRWQGEFRSFWDAGVAQKVAMLSPCSVLVARENSQAKGHLICTDGTERSLDSMKRAAVLAHHCKSPITLFTVSRDHESKQQAEETINNARSMLSELGIGVVAEKIGVGDPTEQICHAGEDFAMITVSDSGKSRLKRFLVGSVAFGVMGRAKTSVLNVR
ncbi:MAG: universal stress protein [Pseudomonadota bacterium]